MPVKPSVPIFPLLKIQINPASRVKCSPMQGEISRLFPLCCGMPRCLFCKNESLFRSAGGTDPQPQRSTELCKKGLELDRDWVVLFCSSANWVSGTGRTGQSGLGLAVSWGSRWEDMQGSCKGGGIRLLSRPSPAPGPPKTHPAPRAPRASPDSRNLLAALYSIGDAPAKDKMGGVNALQSL